MQTCSGHHVMQIIVECVCMYIYLYIHTYIHIKLGWHCPLPSCDLSHVSNELCYVFSSVTQPCPTLCDPMDCSMPGIPVFDHLLEPSNHLIPCRPLLLLPSIFPNIRVFSNESAFCIRWPKYWSFSFSISPSNDYSGLISFRTDWFDLLAVHETFKSLLQHHSLKALISP